MTHEAPTTFDALLGQQGRVRALARSLVRDAAAADDLVQEALLAALRRPTRVAGDGAGLVSRVLRNLARDRARGELRRSRREGEVARSEATSDVADAVVAAERQRALVDSVLALDEPYRGAVLLRWFEELPPRVIARRTGCTVEAVKKQLQRGLQQLRARLEERFGRDGAWAVALLPLTGDAVLRGGAAMVAASALRRAALGVALLSGATVGVSALWPTTSDPREAALASAVSASRTGLAQRSELDRGTESTSTPSTRVAVVDAAGVDDTAQFSASGAAALGARSFQTFDPPFRARLVDLNGVVLARDVLSEIELIFENSNVQAGPQRAGGAAATVRLEPDADGWIESALVPASLLDGLGELEVARGPWAVLAAGARSGVPSERFVVVAPAVRVAGVVQGVDGAPAAATRVQVRADFRAVGTFPFDLATEGRRRWATASDAAGQFEIDRVPTHPRFAITFEAGARGSTAIPTPERDATGVVVRLVLPSVRTNVSLNGRVIDAVGAAVEGADVKIAWLEAKSDARGEFRFDIDPETLRAIASSFGSPLAAIAPDGRFVCVTIGPEDPGPYLLRLPSEMLRIAGRLVDASGSPLEGVRVVLYDGTRTGSSKTLEAPDSAGTTGQGVTDSKGRFVFEQLLDRPYTLRFLREEPLLVLDAAEVAAGTQDLVVRVPDDLFLPLVSGRAVDQTGRPLPGIRVSVIAFECAPGVVRTTMTGPSVRADEAGRFELRGVPRREVSLDFDARPDDGIGGFRVSIEALDAAFVGDVAVELDCDVFARLTEGFIGAQVRFVDAGGASMPVSRVMTYGNSYEWQISQEGDGTFGHLYVPQRAAAVEVLDRDGRTLRRVALTLSPHERNQLEL